MGKTANKTSPSLCVPKFTCSRVRPHCPYQMHSNEVSPELHCDSEAAALPGSHIHFLQSLATIFNLFQSYFLVFQLHSDKGSLLSQEQISSRGESREVLARRNLHNKSTKNTNCLKIAALNQRFAEYFHANIHGII